ncbi:helix-turn-helix domain-containing protein [Candidatus Woesearchaeota archaeon]|nr:helix-turn-helix domain-containing protein [Candidatus Woesearchaeota archaeon]
MSQLEICEFLKKHKEKWFTAKEIAKAQDMSLSSITNCLRKLRYSGFIHYKLDKKVSRQGNTNYVYQYKK